LHPDFLFINDVEKFNLSTNLFSKLPFLDILKCDEKYLT